MFSLPYRAAGIDDGLRVSAVGIVRLRIKIEVSQGLDRRLCGQGND